MVEDSLKGQLLGFHMRHLRKGKVVFNKSRGWLGFIEEVEAVLGYKIKILTTVRDIRAVVASFEKLYQNRGIDWQYPVGEDYFKAVSQEGRANILLRTSGLLGMTIERVRDVFLRNKFDRVHIIPYQKLLITPQETMNGIHEFLDLPMYNYDFENIEQKTHEVDEVHGMGKLHTIKNKISPPENIPWQGILNDNLVKRLEVDYADINALASNLD